MIIFQNDIFRIYIHFLVLPRFVVLNMISDFAAEEEENQVSQSERLDENHLRFTKCICIIMIPSRYCLPTWLDLQVAH